MTMRSMVPFGRGGSTLPSRMSGDDPFVRLWTDIDRLFSSFVQGPGLPGWQPDGTVGLPMEVYEEENKLKVVADLPGVEENDVTVELAGNVLTIKGEKRTDQERSQEGYHLAERRYGTFSRSLQLPYEIEADKVQASFRNGVLTVTMPKPAEQQAKRIEIRKAA
jgi:HSP20 family protein